MATNQYFNKYRYQPEQDLMDSLTVESIRQMGIDCHYIPRQTDGIDRAINSHGGSYFDSAYPMEMYIASADGFGGQQSFMSKFGLSFERQVTLVVARSTFGRYVPELAIPRMGDLVYFSIGGFGYTFEIKSLDYETPLFQFGANYIFNMKCEQFVYSSERFSTGFEFIDAIQVQNAYAVDVLLDTGTGDFTIGETVSNGNTSAKVLGWNSINHIIKLADLTGDINITSNTSSIVGSTAAWLVSTPSANLFDDVNDSLAQNDDFANVKTVTLDTTTEPNIFGFL